MVGLAVDYLTRFMNGESITNAFSISLKGALLSNQKQKAKELLCQIKGLDDTSISAACKLVGYDQMYRAGYAVEIDAIQPNAATLSNIRIMVNRSLCFLKSVGPVTKSGFTLEGRYTQTVVAGDGDYLTADTLWDFKVSIKGATNKQTLQVLMYCLMGKHSIHPEFDSIQYIGIFNPRLHRIYRIGLAAIPSSVIKEIEDVVIGYSASSAHTASIGFATDQKSFPETLSCKEEPDFYTVSDIVQKFGFSRSEVYKFINSGTLKANKKGNRYIIRKLTFYEFLEEQKRLQRETTIAFIVLIIVLSILFLSFLSQ